MPEYEYPAVTVDLVLFTVMDAVLKVLLIQRKFDPFGGSWALPGGYLEVGDAIHDQGEDLEVAARRELAEETHLDLGEGYLEQLYTFGTPGRDPRRRTITVAYMALITPEQARRVWAGDDAGQARWFAFSGVPAALAFDHAKILTKAVERLRGKIDYTSIAADLIPNTFRVAELRSVYEAVKGTEYEPSNFRRKFRRMVEDGKIEPAVGKRITISKPAAVYRFTGR